MARFTYKLAQPVKPIDDLVGAGEAVLLALISRAASWGASIRDCIMVGGSAQGAFGLSWGLSLAIAARLNGTTIQS